MKRYLMASAVALACSCLPVGMAMAGDGFVCFSSILTYTQSSTYGTFNYPQIDNATTFTCSTSATYTIKHISQAGWTIANMQPVTYSSTVATSGAVTTKFRYQLTIQKVP